MGGLNYGFTNTTFSTKADFQLAVADASRWQPSLPLCRASREIWAMWPQPGGFTGFSPDFWMVGWWLGWLLWLKGGNVANSITAPDGLPSGKLTYPWKITFFNGKIHYKWPFSIAFCMFTRGYRCVCHPNFGESSLSRTSITLMWEPPADSGGVRSSTLVDHGFFFGVNWCTSINPWKT